MSLNRLAPRLAAAMIGTTILSLLILLTALQIADYQNYMALPSEVRERVPPPRLDIFHRPVEKPFRGGPGEGFGPPGRPGMADEDRPFSYEAQAQLFEARRATQERTLLIGMLVAAALTILLAVLLSRSIARPIAAVTRAADGVAAGDFSARVSLTPRQQRSHLETDRLAVTFNQMSGALESYERERKAMVADIAHELRTPLTAMQMRLEAIQDGLVPMTRVQADNLLRQTDTLSRLVEDLRTLSLADAGKLTLRRQETDLTELAGEVLASFEARAKRQGVQLRLAAVNDVIPTALVDQTRLIQVMSNLVDNALRVTPAGGEVLLSVAQDGSGARLEVLDSGPGIPESDLPHIFERFVQSKDTKGSSGLGLAIVDALVKLHGGTVRAVNRAGGGAAFQVTLPSGAA